MSMQTTVTCKAEHEALEVLHTLGQYWFSELSLCRLEPPAFVERPVGVSFNILCVCGMGGSLEASRGQDLQKQLLSSEVCSCSLTGGPPTPQGHVVRTRPREELTLQCVLWASTPRGFPR